MTMPNFLIIGAGKAGTTALHQYLGQHPDIYMSPRKELRFFPFENQKPAFCGPGDSEDADNFVTKIEDYRACFAPGASFQARGEASPCYLYYPQAAERIRHYVPDAKLIAILRHPADRAYSHYMMLRRDGLEHLSFGEALAAEDRRVADDWGHRWHHRRRGFYAAQLESYFGFFKREQCRVYLYDDYLADPIGFIQDIFRFLNVDDTLVPDTSVRHNASLLPRNRALHAFLNEPRFLKNQFKSLVPAKLCSSVGDRFRRLNLTRLPFPVEQRRQLIEVYREDIVKLQAMLQRDLTHWLE